MTVHNYITPEGEVRWVKDMPVNPHVSAWALPSPASSKSANKLLSDYQLALSKAKEESVPWENQKWATDLIFAQEMDKCKNNEVFTGLKPGSFYSFEFNGEVKVVNACASDCCTQDGECEHCREPLSVARLIPSVTEQEEPQKPSVVETEIDEQKLWDEVKTYYVQQSIIRRGVNEIFKDLSDNFTITRKSKKP